ncbi:hypothetical protein PS910_04319 [Pseudomonas fluorescens]|nr:hypothetical protein PS910_04319 [Pseudomonas fluorescens]
MAQDSVHTLYSHHHGRLHNWLHSQLGNAADAAELAQEHFDASVDYDLGKVGLRSVDLRLNANKLTNESYIASCASLNYCYLGEERNVRATVSYQF